MSRRTSGGRARRSRRLDPIQITGLSASVMPIYVYLYTRKEAGRAILPGRACSFNQRFTARQYSLGLLTPSGPYAYPRPVLLARGAVMGRCEGGAAVGREAGDSVFRAHRAGPKGPADAAPAGGGYAPCALGRPWPAVRRHDDRLPAALRSDGLHAVATKERRPLLRIGGLNTGPVPARKRGPREFQDAACGAPGGAFLRSQGGRRRLRTVSRAAFAGRSGARSQALRVSRRSAPLVGEREEAADCGSPGADQRIRA